MKIQFNTDKTINGDEKHEAHFTELIAKELKRFESHITRIEVHLSDENGKKEGLKDIQCLLEARLEGIQPIAVSCKESTITAAVNGAIDKLKSSLDSTIGRLQNR